MLKNDLLPEPTLRLLFWRPLQSKNWHAQLTAAGAIIAVWRQRARSRRALATLDDDRLRDIGQSRAAARLESEKPFWAP